MRLMKGKEMYAVLIQMFFFSFLFKYLQLGIHVYKHEVIYCYVHNTE